MLIFSGLPGAKWLTILTIVASAATLLTSTIYFRGADTPRFLLEKGAWAQQPWWLAALHFHVAGASTCLAAGAPLMFPAFTRHYPAWHRRLGYVYLTAILWMAAPTGLALSFVAKGGIWGSYAFGIAGLWWWHTTWCGYQAIRRGDIAAHVRGMVRSYCLALSAPAFRLIQVLLFACGLEDGPNYVISLWLSIGVSVWLAESFVNRQRRGVASPAAPLGAGVSS